MRKVTIKSTYGGTLNLGNYENLKLEYGLEETIEVETDKEILERHRKQDQLCYNQFDKHVRKKQREK